MSKVKFQPKQRSIKYTENVFKYPEDMKIDSSSGYSFNVSVLSSREQKAASIIKRFLRNSMLKVPRNFYQFYEEFKHSTRDDMICEVPNLPERFSGMAPRFAFSIHYVCREMMAALRRGLCRSYAELDLFDNCLLDNIPCRVTLYTSKLVEALSREGRCTIGSLILVNNMSPDNFLKDKVLQGVHISGVEYGNGYKLQNAVFNVLFHLDLIFETFKYNPMFSVLYHPKQIEGLLKIKMFGRKYLNSTYKECVVCLEPCVERTACNHALCIKCRSQLRKAVCPMCRFSFVFDEDMDDPGASP